MGLMRAWRVPLMRCRRSPLQFQKTMLGLTMELLAIEDNGRAKDRVNPG
jgi:hypothetical protein